MKNSLKAQIIELAGNSDIDLLAFAPVERFENAPAGILLWTLHHRVPVGRQR
jgi:hypothetical protein